MASKVAAETDITSRLARSGPKGPRAENRAAAGSAVRSLELLVEEAAAGIDAPVVLSLVEDGVLVRRVVTAAHRMLLGSAVDTVGTICGQAFGTGDVIHCADVLADPGAGPDTGCCPGALSKLSVPVLVRGRIRGVVAALGQQPGWFDGADEQIVVELAAAITAVLAGSSLAPLASPKSPTGAGVGAPVVPCGFQIEDVQGGDVPAITGRVPVQPGPERALPVNPSTSTTDAMPPGTSAEPPPWVPALGLRAARELTGIGFWEWNPADDSLAWSAEMYRLAGLIPGEITPTLARWHQSVHVDDLDTARRLDVLALDRFEGQVETFRVIGSDGALRHVRAWSVPVHRDGTQVVHGAAVDVTAEVQDRLSLEQLSATDPVTRLGNRVAFEKRIRQLLADPSRDVSLLLLDLDRFKVINDSLGHQWGDRLLVEVARRLAGVVPGGSLTARMGGDEFVVVPRPGVGWVQVRRLAETIVESLRQPYVLSESGEMLVCPVSVGVTSTSGREVSAEDLLSEADLALYQAKDSGRDRYVVFDHALRSRARGRHLAEQLLRSALERGWLTLRYQPIADLRTGRVVGAEALVRISDPAGGSLVLPDAFIEVAEDTGLVVELDCWVIDTALDQLTRWARDHEPGGTPWLAVNVSARSMEHPRVVERLLDGLRRRGLPPQVIKVELTEHSFLGTLPGGDATLRSLINSGVPVGIDDFGTGYSALAYLQRFELNFMKIDRSFVASVGEAERADAVVTAIVDLAHAHGMQVTAEGIENPLQARRLHEIGCDFAQGFHVGRPVEAALLID